MSHKKQYVVKQRPQTAQPEKPEEEQKYQPKYQRKQNPIVADNQQPQYNEKQYDQRQARQQMPVNQQQYQRQAQEVRVSNQSMYQHQPRYQDQQQYYEQQPQAYQQQYYDPYYQEYGYDYGTEQYHPEYYQEYDQNYYPAIQYQQPNPQPQYQQRRKQYPNQQQSIVQQEKQKFVRPENYKANQQRYHHGQSYQEKKSQINQTSTGGRQFLQEDTRQQESTRKIFQLKQDAKPEDIQRDLDQDFKVDEQHESQLQSVEDQESTANTETYEDYIEEDEAQFLNSAGQNNNQISSIHYACGPRTENVKKPCIVLMVAEKPSIALSITEALSCGKFTKSNGYSKSLPVYVFQALFKGHQATVKVTSVAGHVFNRDFPSKFQDRKTDPESLYDAPTLRKLDKSSKSVATHLSNASRNLDFLVLWLDCDKEGENICFEVLDICKRNIPKSKLQRVYRAKFSSIASKDIQQAYQDLRHEPNFNEAVSVDARQVLDLKIGVSFSRFQTKELSKCLKNRAYSVITYGPCQTPTLGFCVDQAEKIKKFIPEPFWKIQLEVKAKCGTQVALKWLRGKIYDQQVVKSIYERMANIQDAEVIEVKKQRTTQVRPVGINTVKLLKVASQSFGFSAQDTLRIAEHLYLRGYTTYPRTESTDFSPNFNFKEILQEHQQHPDWGQFANKLLKNGWNRPKKGVDAGDHPPITPVKAATRGELSDGEWRVYQFIARSFLGCISSDATYDSVAVVFQSASETFKLQGRILVEPGFLEVMTWHNGSDKEVPEFKEGEIVKVVNSKIIEGVTQAPGYLTEANLIAKMEKYGIGTDASIATHINNIIQRNYVQVRDPGRQLVPTPLGQALVRGYCEIDPELVLPQVRSNIEKSCELVARGRVDFQRVVNHVLQIFKAKFNHFKLSIGIMEKLFTIMSMTDNPEKNKELLLTYKIPQKSDSDNTQINYCTRCFNGYLNIQYHSKKGWGLKCDTCNFRVGVLERAGAVYKTNEKCNECNSYKVQAQYKDDSPFPGGAKSRTGCVLCDSVMRATVVNLYFKQQKNKTPQEIEEENKRREERNREKEEKKKKKEELEAKNSQKTTQPKPKKEKNTKAPNILTAEDKIREFQRKMMGEQE